MTSFRNGVPADTVRTMFSKAMSTMYRREVPQYGQLLELVQEVKRSACSRDPRLAQRLRDNGEVERLDLERHGAIRLGTPAELAIMRRMFAVMGMHPVGYYDLSSAGVPVHSTAFRPLETEALRRNPFRVFTSLLRLDLIDRPDLRRKAAEILAQRRIYTPRCLELIDLAEAEGGLGEATAAEFVREALETFRWHTQATVSAQTYATFRQAHPLLADIVCFKGPHINHLTPRTLDIDRVQAGMLAHGMTPKAIIEGPPRREVPILLRQTSFRALDERIVFAGADDGQTSGTHAARFGEVEQRGVALTRRGRTLYDTLLAEVRQEVQVKPGGINADDYMRALANRFRAFPDDETTLRCQKLAYFRYMPTARSDRPADASFDALVASGHIRADPMTYEDFLPVSAAGIFSSNLGDEGPHTRHDHSGKAMFEGHLGAVVADEDALYAAAERRSVEATTTVLRNSGWLGSDPAL